MAREFIHPRWCVNLDLKVEGSCHLRHQCGLNAGRRHRLTWTTFVLFLDLCLHRLLLGVVAVRTGKTLGSGMPCFLCINQGTITSPPLVAEAKYSNDRVCLSLCVFVCLSTTISLEIHALSPPIFFCMLPVAVARSSSGSIVIC